MMKYAECAASSFVICHSGFVIYSSVEFRASGFDNSSYNPP